MMINWCFSHNGKRHFSITDVELDELDKKRPVGDINAIVSIGDSNKPEEEKKIPTRLGKKKIGKFGLGFKSVFLNTHRPLKSMTTNLSL
ncbi:MAG: hypothetical protein L6U16_07500 [Porphyromonadaceae bacterium]|nr:MAG: hypothetical protein L6U16_07500 [Porphyromonadaceae bacterium]